MGSNLKAPKTKEQWWALNEEQGNQRRSYTFPTPGPGSPFGGGRGITTLTKLPADDFKKNAKLQRNP